MANNLKFLIPDAMIQVDDPVNRQLTAADAVLNGFFTVDRKWKIVAWNQAAQELLGVTKQEAIGHSYKKEFSKLMPVDIYLLYSEMVRTNSPCQLQKNLGTIGNWSNIVVFFSDEMLSISFKSTDKAPLDQMGLVIQHPSVQLKTINDLYRAVTEVTNDCLWEWDLATNQIFWIDGGHKRHFGYEIENMLVPMSFWVNHIHPDDRGMVLESLEKTLDDRSTTIWENTYRFEKQDGSFCYVEERALIIRNQNAQPIRLVGATCDVHEKKFLENALIDQRLANQRELIQAVLTGQEQERAKIGDELQDNLAQILATTKMYLQMGIKSKEKRGLYMDKSLGFIVQVMNEISRISKSLIIPKPHIIGMTDNINNLLRDLSKVHPIKVQLRTNGINDDSISEKLQIAIYRIIQEQVDNILEHSEASEAIIELKQKDKHIILSVKDNGNGCDVNDNRKGVGLLNIRSRADLFSGSVSVISEPKKGYELRVDMISDSILTDHSRSY